VQKLTDDLNTIQGVMRKTIDDVLDRGNKLEDVGEISKNLASESKRYKWSAKKLSLHALYKQYAPIIGIAVVALIILIIRFVW
jgi:vesicle transport protein SEC22